MSRMISRGQWEAIQSDYDYFPNANDYEMQEACKVHEDWEQVYAQGSDSKYGTIMVSHSMRAWRNPTAGEFYGGAAWD